MKILRKPKLAPTVFRCAGWMRIDAKVERYNMDDELEEISILDEFIEWLEEIDI